MQEDAWVRRKRMFWRRMWEDLEIGYLDKDLLPLLILLNTERKVYTMSSCSGRIVASDSETPWERGVDSTVIFKKHVPVEPGELLRLYSIPVNRKIWLNVTGPIIHLSARDLQTAARILRIARLSGYKHSGIISLSRSKGVILELTTGVYLSIPLRTRGGDVVGSESIDGLVELANATLYEGKKRLSRLYMELKRSIPWSPDDEVMEYIVKHGIRIHERDPLEVFGELSRGMW
ncbi:tRNA(Phe) 7-((3-amino-3-carboxypropyl)-4-demethylwyosine(37)-N(4))-methyltransferase [Desulfurococcus mucosus]|uniref:tRNA(Phe) 7-((3-amino-3-carboxypropyl)-4-demethylwyosine(37)-N(4))-methyltransferase n=1 Tax=Desulfurococcus mucosus (strain ATCC 35584 / DSM 2162 / JCM 9187 / O7/1) TaxID=765177 RepID=E8R9M6_DESM0|nr:hypothetical protein [Desulfurococcus mucosus]ADV65202.1 protein of unknown function DUF207 [Desulfurococcus mucosus DSM 2162]